LAKHTSLLLSVENKSKDLENICETMIPVIEHNRAIHFMESSIPKFLNSSMNLL
jgi:hypothetical protein